MQLFLLSAPTWIMHVVSAFSARPAWIMHVVSAFSAYTDHGCCFCFQLLHGLWMLFLLSAPTWIMHVVSAFSAYTDHACCFCFQRLHGSCMLFLLSTWTMHVVSALYIDQSCVLFLFCAYTDRSCCLPSAPSDFITRNVSAFFPRLTLSDAVTRDPFETRFGRSS